MSLNRVLSISLYVLMAISVLLVILFYFGGRVEGTVETINEEPLITNNILFWAYGLVVAAAIFAIAFPLVYMVMHPKNAYKAVIAIAFFGLVALISYFLASDLPLKTELALYDNPGELKWVGVGLYTTYIFLGLAVFGILYSEIAKFFK